MTTVTRSVTINDSTMAIWEVLAALDRYHEWESGYVSSAYTSPQTSGRGTMRRVELKSPMGVRYAIHEVTRWEEGSVIAWRATESNFPMLATAEQTVTLRPEVEHTMVENSVTYDLKYGVLGKIADPIMFRRVVVGANEGFLASLTALLDGTG